MIKVYMVFINGVFSRIKYFQEKENAKKLYKGKWRYFRNRICYTTRIFQTGFFRSNKRSLLLIKFNEKLHENSKKGAYHDKRQT